MSFNRPCPKAIYIKPNRENVAEFITLHQDIIYRGTSAVFEWCLCSCSKVVSAASTAVKIEETIALRWCNDSAEVRPGLWRDREVVEGDAIFVARYTLAINALQ
ncbi:hypothetical protein BDZ89DRAFT_1129879 [Hymenopellis radicata]|nr:hypothetical protein BDZ89DRAFT_1129879 [Hymenopellis radicata]